MEAPAMAEPPVDAASACNRKQLNCTADYLHQAPGFHRFGLGIGAITRENRLGRETGLFLSIERDHEQGAGFASAAVSVAAREDLSSRDWVVRGRFQVSGAGPLGGHYRAQRWQQTLVFVLVGGAGKLQLVWLKVSALACLPSWPAGLPATTRNQDRQEWRSLPAQRPAPTVVRKAG